MTEGSAWPEVEIMAVACPVPVRVLPVDADRGEACRAELGVGVGSRLGAVVAHSGGLSVDHGWLRVLGGGADELGWVDLGLGYGAWLAAVLSGATTSFYADLRWSGWEAEVGGLALDQGVATYPPPWTTEGKDLGAVARRAVPLAELVAAHDDARRGLDAP